MFKFISNYFSYRKEKAQAEDYLSGFGYAMSAYCIEELSISELETYIHTARIMGDYGPFDAGFKEAIRTIREFDIKNG